MATAKKTTAKKTAAKKTAAKKTTAKKTAAPKKAAPKKAPAPKAAKVSPVKGKSIETYTATLAPWQQEVARAIGALVAEAAPDATGSIKWAQPVWEHGGPLMFLRGHKNHVTVGFWRGAELDDRGLAFEGEGDRMKHLKIREGESVPQAIGALIRDAVSLNAKLGNPTKKR